jgi:toxin-antitoxin system PIN domain toxin
MTFLLDVNVLIALIDPYHVNHSPAVRWFDAFGNESWATCPITENGVLRIVGKTQYPNSPGSALVNLMREFVALPGHVFWPDDISLLDSAKIDTSRLLTTAQVTDTYLLALAQAHNGKLATLDRRLIVDAVAGGAGALHLIE